MSFWSNRDLLILKAMYKQELPVYEISKVLLRTEASIRNKAYIEGITNANRLSDEDIKYLRDNYKSYNLQEISKKLGRSKQYICRVAKKIGIELNGKKKEITKTYVDENGVSHKNGWERKTKKEIASTRSLIMKDWHSKNEHPKGMLGKTHTREVKKRQSDNLKKLWTDKDSYINSQEYRQLLSDRMSKQQSEGKARNRYSNGRMGTYDINGTEYFFRSLWEVNYALYLDFLKSIKEIKKWEYEVDTFWFEEIKRGVRSYKPDFKVFNNDNSIEYHEVKGWMDPKSKTKLKRMEKYHPGIKIILIDQKPYKEICKKMGSSLNFYT